MAIKIIINADDLGKNNQTNQAIGEALRLHYITSASILANSQTWKEIYKIVKNNSQASFGVHLNLTEGSCLIYNDILRRYHLVDENNEFTKQSLNLRQYPNELLNAIFEEWDAQVYKVTIEEGIPITHFDGHHHIHAIPGLKPVLIRLIQKYHVPCIRNQYCKPLKFYLKRRKNKPLILESNICSASSNLANKVKSSPMRLLTRLSRFIKDELKKHMWTYRIRQSAHITNYFDAYETACNDLEKGCQYPNRCSVELMCHPGHPQFSKEYEMIKSSRIQRFCNAELISYKDL